LTKGKRSNRRIIVLGDVMVSIGLNVCALKPGRLWWIFKAIQIRSTVSFGGEVEPSVTGQRFHGMLKIPSKHEQRYFIGPNS
jgi:hypothetical protein